jgi:hypothetical protein
MLSFKPKTAKKIKVCKKQATTLDGKHKEFVNEFERDEYDIIPRLKEEREELTNLLEELLQTPSHDVDQEMEYKDRIQEINKSIKELKQKKTNYYLDNSKYIFEYFENKKNIDNAEEIVNSTKAITNKSQLVFNLFKVKPETDSEQTTNTETKNKDIVQKYLSNIDESFLDVNAFVRSTDVCQICYKGEMIPLEDEGVVICNICAVSIPFLVENDKPSYKEPPKEVCFYAYKKINHFKEILAQFQGKETTQIPDDVIEQIYQQIKKERIELSDMTYAKTKEILKKLGFNKYYEHIAFIKNKLGIKPPVFSPELEETLCNLFIEIQSPYSKTCPDYKMNFLNYYYVLYKFCELLEETQYLDEIPLLHREKLIEHDETWKKMCKVLDWEFIPTV